MKTVVCVKWGNKYSYDYVNRLHSAVKRNLKGEIRFICYTDDISGLTSEIETRELPTNLNLYGWWFKLWLFSMEADLQGEVLYLDLDVVVINQLEPLFAPVRTLRAIKDWLYDSRSIYKLNSSVMFFRPDQCYAIWEEFNHNRESLMGSYPGDQDWITEKAVHAEMWPDKWMTSYKFDRQYEHIDPATKIVVFHGAPNPPEAIIGTSKFPPCPWIASVWR